MYEENEISLKELILVLINEKKLIALITAAFTIVAIVITLLIPKAYETESQIVFSIPESDNSRFGTFVFPSQNVSDYISLLSSQDVKNEVASLLNFESASSVNAQISFNKENKYVNVKTSSSNPEKAKEINDVYVQTYINQIRAQYKQIAIDKFIYNHEMNLKNLDYQMEKVQSMLDAKTTFLMELNPVYTLQKALFADPKTAALYADKFNLDLGTLSNDVILEEYANEKYLEVEAEVIDLKSSLINMKENYKFSEKLLAELNIEKESFILSLDNNDYTKALNDELDILNGAIHQVNEAVIPVNEVSPKKILNVGIGMMLGMLAAIFAALFKNYWMSNDIKK